MTTTKLRAASEAALYYVSEAQQWRSVARAEADRADRWRGFSLILMVCVAVMALLEVLR